MRRFALLAPFALASAACAVETSPPEGTPPIVEEVDITPKVESAFCVDHPCADLYPANLGRCPLYSRSPTRMKFIVVNGGPVSSLPSTTRITFGSYGAYDRDVPTPGLAANGGAYTIIVDAPPQCASSLCSWKVAADVNNTVTETSSSNNARSSFCDWT
ncbi:MAG TPA: CARDB domain-containing protein [Labilithrix sp.]|nr:CARDB domain-containing protein [Labilithrix sp.]